MTERYDDFNKIELMYKKLADNLPPDSEHGKMFALFSQKKAIKHFPVTIKVAGINMKISVAKDKCHICGKETIFDRTTAEVCDNYIEIWTISFCEKCNKWMVNKVRNYPREKRQMVMTSGGWEECSQKKTLFSKLVDELKVSL